MDAPKNKGGRPRKNPLPETQNAAPPPEDTDSVPETHGVQPEPQSETLEMEVERLRRENRLLAAALNTKPPEAICPAPEHWFVRVREFGLLPEKYKNGGRVNLQAIYDDLDADPTLASKGITGCQIGELV